MGRSEQKQLHRKSAFTLIELSVVLIGIGLLVGGVLVGKTLLEAATLRSVISEQEKVKLAITTFKLKYNCLPGDCSRATSYFPGVVNGDGNSRISTASIPSTSARESQLVWKELALARYIEGSYTGQLGTSGQDKVYEGAELNSYPTIYAKNAGYSAEFQPLDFNRINSNYLVLQANNTVGGDPSGLAIFISAQHTSRIDSKIDDGKPGLGKVLGQGGCLTNYTCPGYPSNCHNMWAWGAGTWQTAFYSTSSSAYCKIYFLLD